jgi:hypothetical protein
VAHSSAKEFQFRTGLAGDQDQRHSPPINLGEGILCGRPRIGVVVEESAVEVGKDQVTGAQHG